ncbi:MAG: tetratricopeptide repeat protein, partial [Candidatus Electrothrix sp. AR1]|nr:tetratricopeptide repeat protein [Candidatus Electrothrix sp. AR1]
SELENFSWEKKDLESGQQMIDFLQGKLAIAQGCYTNAIEKIDQVLSRRDLLVGKDDFASEALVALGESYFLPGDHSNSLNKLEGSLGRLEGQEEKYPVISASAHWIIGRIYRSQGNMEKADRHLGRCIELSVKTGNYYFAGYGLCTLGEVYQMRGDYKTAIKCLKESLAAMSRKDKNRKRAEEIIGRSLHILGRVYQFQGRWKESENELSRSLELREKITKGKPQHSLGYAYWGFGWFYLFQRNASAAFDNLEKSENIFKTLNEKDGIARTYRLQAEVCLMQDDNEQAAELLRKAIAIQEEKKGNYELGLLHLGLTRYHIAMENWQEAVETNEKARILCEGSGDHWAQVKSDILQCQIDMHLSQYDDLESRISKAHIEVENFPDLMFELELVRGEYAVKTDRLNDSVKAYNRAYSKAKEFYHPDEHNADYVARVIYDKVQSLPKEKSEEISTGIPEVWDVAAK